MKVGIIGSGDVGRTLSNGFAKYGYDVKLGTRDPGQEKIKKILKDNNNSFSAATFSEAAEHGEIIVLATLWTGTESALNLAGLYNFSGKIVIDVTNPLDFSQGIPPGLAVGHTDSGGEQIQRWLADAKVVKAFNIVGHALMINPDLPGGPPDMFICGNDTDAKKQVTKILNEFGWPEVIDIGDIKGSRELESLCILWVKYAIIKGGWNHAIKMLRK